MDNKALRQVVDMVVEKFAKGGPGSGNFGHAGRPGLRGGSAPRGGGILTGAQARRKLLAVDASISARSKKATEESRARGTAMFEASKAGDMDEFNRLRDISAEKRGLQVELFNERKEAYAKILEVDNPTKARITTDELKFDVSAGTITQAQANAIANEVELFKRYVSEDAMPDVRVRVFGTDERPSAFPGSASHSINTTGTFGVTTHELGHVLEFSNPSITARASAFLNARTAGEPAVSLRELTGLNYDESEVARPDKFSNPYTGRVYKSGNTEILSMGLERMVKDPVAFAKEDPEFFDFIYDSARGR